MIACHGIGHMHSDALGIFGARFQVSLIFQLKVGPQVGK